MKVKVNYPGMLFHDSIREAITNNEKTIAVVFDDSGVYYGLGIQQFTIIEDPQQVAQQKPLVSLKDLLGYDVARIEFK